MEGLTCLWAYEGIAKKLIKQAKYKYYYDYLNELMGEVGGREELFYLNKFLDSKPIVVPVPLHPKRQRERGFNQAEVIALSLASRHKLSLNSHLLQRVRDTGRQVERSREERLKAMSDAFKINPNFQISNSVLLVDDVWTTGATMSEAAKVLKQARVKVVWGWVLAR
jgi:ComF family protein